MEVTMPQIHDVHVVPPVQIELKVTCEGHQHRVVIANGEMDLKDHNVRTLKAFTAFDAPMPPCLKLLEMWKNHPPYVLRVLELLPPKPHGVYEYLDASTGHITYEDAEILNRIADGELIIQREHGWWIWVSDERYLREEHYGDRDLSKSFFELLEYASDTGCYWLLLDNDANTIPGLTVHDW